MKWRLRVLSAMRGAELNSIKLLSNKNTRRKPRNYHRNRGFAVEEMDRLSEHNFQRMFRMDRSTFHEICEKLHPFLTRNELKARNSSGSVITTETRLAVTLRWLAGGCYLDLCFAWGISKASFYSDRGVLWPTIEALDKCEDYNIGFPIDNQVKLQE